MKQYLLILLMITVLDVSIVDSNGDTSKAVFLIPYSDGTMDKLVVDKKKISDPAVLDAIDQIIDHKLGKHGSK